MQREKAMLVLAALAMSAALANVPVFARGGGHGSGSSGSHSSSHSSSHNGGHTYHANSRWRANVGVFIGPGWYAPYYYPYPPYYPYYYPYYYPPVVAAPPTYIEQASPEALPSGYWYYCSSGEGYYPYVRECPGGWQRVAPQPAN